MGVGGRSQNSIRLGDMQGTVTFHLRKSIGHDRAPEDLASNCAVVDSTADFAAI